MCSIAVLAAAPVFQSHAQTLPADDAVEVETGPVTTTTTTISQTTTLDKSHSLGSIPQSDVNGGMPSAYSTPSSLPGPALVEPNATPTAATTMAPSPSSPLVQPPADVPPVQALTPQQAAAESALQPQTSGSVTYITGGVGDEEKAALAEAKKNYNLSVMIANKDGSFVGDTRLTIRGTKGEELMTTTAGPLFYAKLPAGTYTVEVVKGDQVKKEKAKIGTKGASNLNFSW